MEKKKIFILLPDGIGLRNFAFTRFYDVGVAKGFQITYWNSTLFDVSQLGYGEIKIQNIKHHPLTEIYKNARKHIELNMFVSKFRDKTYDSYRFPFPVDTLKKKIKTKFTKALIAINNSENGLLRVRRTIERLEKRTELYRNSLSTLKREKPELVFCTNQRPMTAIAPILAAKDLGIPTATFIFSWDNLPKATMVVETDYYFVWSEFMKHELLRYYPYIKESQVCVTGTPQFENHFQYEHLMDRNDFFEKYNLDKNKRYFCFSGDDITTSPDDPQYLFDIAKAVSELNAEGLKLGVIFRRCPVDFSSRYDWVLNRFKGLIVPIDPLWVQKGEMWNEVIPTKEDLKLQLNTIAHTEFAINLGSSMVFDYALHNKKCAYINYDVENKKLQEWSVDKIYKYIHFRSMPDKDAVTWFNNPSEIRDKIKGMIYNSDSPFRAKLWSDVILGEQPTKASEKIWDEVDAILKFRF